MPMGRFWRGRLGILGRRLFVTEVTSRPLWRMALALFIAVAGWLSVSTPLLGLTEIAQWDILLIPFLSIAAALGCAHLRLEQGPWKLEAPFIAATLATLGPSWAMGTWAAARVATFIARGGRLAPRRAMQEFGGIAIAVGLGALSHGILYLPAPLEAGAFVVIWLSSVQLLRSHSVESLGPIAIMAMLGAALSGLADVGPGWWAMVGLVPSLLIVRIARAEIVHQTRLDQTLQALALMLQRAHPYTHAHIERVARIAERTARNLGLSETRAQHVHDAARLHDIGKIAIDEQVLDKPGTLTAEEYAHVKLHAPFGAAILEEIRSYRHLADWIRFHHERPDGSGYPDGLRGEQIPIEARIIAVADAYDAMTGGLDGADRRPYRDPLTQTEALAELERCSGSQFDPNVVRAFRQALAEEIGA